MDNQTLLKEIMAKVQKYANTWSGVSGTFDSGEAFEDAIRSQQELEKMIDDALRATDINNPIHPELAFAKLYQFTDVGQVLITIGESNDGNPTVYFRFQHNGLDFNPSLSFAKTELGSEESCKYFEELTRERAYSIASNTIASIQEAINE